MGSESEILRSVLDALDLKCPCVFHVELALINRYICELPLCPGKVLEEVAEVMEVTDNPIEAEKEIGDLLLAVTSLARMLHVNAEEALFHATNRFIDRFEAIEQEIEARGLDIATADRDELERIWDENKKKTVNSQE